MSTVKFVDNDIRFDLQIIASWIEPGSRVLDLGCGEGHLLHFLKEKKKVVGTGIESVEAKVEKCIEKYAVIKKLRSFEAILPVCCKCKKIRTDSDAAPGKGEWINLEQYLSTTTNARISHGYCNKCSEEIADNNKK